MSDVAALKALTRETKALVIVSEFEARRMPMFQLRSVLNTLVKDEEEKKTIIDLIERDLTATGYPAEQISTFLSDLVAVGQVPVIPESVQSTRRLRSPFAMGFDGQSSPPPSDSGSGTAVRAAPSATAIFMQRNPAAAAPIPSPSTKPLSAPASLPISRDPEPPRDEPLRAMPSMPPVPSVTSTGSNRRSTMVFETAPRPTPLPSAAVTDAPPPAPAPRDTMMPAGQKTIFRHELAFSNVPTAATKPPVQASTPKPGESRPTVLIADDDRRIRMVFRLRIEEAGMSVIECGDGNEAWQFIQNGALAACVLDMKMPGLHGLEILARMADKQIRLPVVVCSAYDQLKEEFVIQTTPHLKYLVKPVAPETLVNTLKDLLSAKNAT